jgi:hypothetical protein
MHPFLAHHGPERLGDSHDAFPGQTIDRSGEDLSGPDKIHFLGAVEEQDRNCVYHS